MLQPSVLVVGNELSVRTSAARFLNASGFVAFQAVDASAALRVLDAVRVTAVLLDGDHLAEASSADLLGYICRREPRLWLVYLTVKEPALVHPAAAASIVHKPCQPSRLLSLLRGRCETV